MPDAVKQFFAWSDLIDHSVLRPLSHIRGNWEITWDHKATRYEPEEDSFASSLNTLIDQLREAMPPASYHVHEDALAEYVVRNLNWPIRKEKNRWVGSNYDSILEQGGLHDVDQEHLISAAAGRIDAAIKRGQLHFDQMEESHRRMLGAVLTIILYCRSDFSD